MRIVKEGRYLLERPILRLIEPRKPPTQTCFSGLRSEVVPARELLRMDAPALVDDYEPQPAARWPSW